MKMKIMYKLTPKFCLLCIHAPSLYFHFHNILCDSNHTHSTLTLLLISEYNSNSQFRNKRQVTYALFVVADGRDSTPRQIRRSLKTTRQCTGPQWGPTYCSSCTTRVPCLCSATSQQGRGSQDTGRTCHSHLYCSQHWLTPGTAPHIPRSSLSVITLAYP